MIALIEALTRGPLAPLTAYRQFIVYALVPSQSRPGKLDKWPLDWRTGATVNAHDPAVWTDHQTAAAAAARLGASCGVGFVFTEADPFFFLDIDACHTGAGWSDLATQLCAWFPGAAIEVSASGKGLHVFGTYQPGQIPAHGCKAVAYGLELYHTGRFVALTGSGAIGNAATDCTAVLPHLIAHYFPPGDGSADADWWTDAPCEGWNGPTDDAELIRRALRSQSVAGAFGGRASFADLWRADEVVLARSFPDGGGRAYDASSADAALAQHLAFWTGNDADRMERLMRQSALVRDKWDRKGDDYLARTIRGACGRQHEVCQDKPKAEPPAAREVLYAGGASATSPEAQAIAGSTFLAVADQPAHFQGCIYVRDVDRILVPGGDLLKKGQFDATYGRRTFMMDATNQRTSRSAWECFLESQAYEFPWAHSLCFRPELGAGGIVEDAGRRLANLYYPTVTKRVTGDAGPFLRHLEKLLPDSRDRSILLAYLAAIVQNPGRKFQWCVLLQGVEGNGKTFINTCISHAIGDKFCHTPNAQDLGGNGGKFTGWLQGKLFISIEEIHTANKREVLEILKPLITNMRIEIQAKGADQFTGDNRANFILYSNHKDAISKTARDRRYCIFYTAQQTPEDLQRDGMDGAYFRDLWDWFRDADGAAIINDFLRNYQIPDELNPAGGCQRAPKTTSTDEAIHVSRGTVEQHIVDAIEEGRPGFCGGWVSSAALDALLDTLKASSRIPPNKRREMMQGIHYDLHPGLIGGRVNNPVLPDGKKCRLYVKEGHLARNIHGAAAIAAAYTKAQQEAAAAYGGAIASSTFTPYLPSTP